MKITIVTGPWLPVPAVQGGSVPRMWDGLARQFAARGHDTNIVARSYPGQASAETVSGVRFLRWGGFSQSRSIWRDLAKDAFYAAALLPRLPNADIIVINDFWLPVFTGLFRRSGGAIVISANRFPKGQYWMYGKAPLIAAASTAIGEAIAKQCSRLQDRIAVLPNPIDTDVFSPESNSTRGARPPTILYVGRIHPEKGVHVLVKAFAGISRGYPEARLRIVGPSAENQGGGGEVYQNELRAAAANLPVCFDDPVFEVDRLAQVYRDADIFCYPSLAEKGESFGVAALEAMATGLAPIVSRLSCFNDFVIDGETGWVFDHRAVDPAAALAEKIETMLTDPGRGLVMGRRAAELARQFNFSQVADMFLERFSTIARAAHPR